MNINLSHFPLNINLEQKPGRSTILHQYINNITSSGRISQDQQYCSTKTNLMKTLMCELKTVGTNPC